MFRQRSESIPKAFQKAFQKTFWQPPRSLKLFPRAWGGATFLSRLLTCLLGVGANPPANPNSVRAGLSEWPLSRLKMDLLRTPRSVSLSLSQRFAAQAILSQGLQPQEEHIVASAKHSEGFPGTHKNHLWSTKEWLHR